MERLIYGIAISMYPERVTASTATAIDVTADLIRGQLVMLSTMIAILREASSADIEDSYRW